MINWIKKELIEYKYLLRNVPGTVTALFVVSVIGMNLLANKELLNIGWLALDCGYALSWLSFLCMDMLCKRFGGKAGVKMSIFALAINLVLTGLFKLMTLTPGMWAAFYDTGLTEVNTALNSTFGGTWYIVLGSSVAMLVSSLVNASVNVGIGKLCKTNSYKAFAARSFISTGLGQFVDNFVFGTMVSKVFFGWTWSAVILCALSAALVELLFEIIFSPIGFKISKNWETEKVGQQYVDMYCKA